MTHVPSGWQACGPFLVDKVGDENGWFYGSSFAGLDADYAEGNCRAKERSRDTYRRRRWYREIKPTARLDALDSANTPVCEGWLGVRSNSKLLVNRSEWRSRYCVIWAGMPKSPSIGGTLDSPTSPRSPSSSHSSNSDGTHGRSPHVEDPVVESESNTSDYVSESGCRKTKEAAHAKGHKQTSSSKETRIWQRGKFPHLHKPRSPITELKDMCNSPLFVHYKSKSLAEETSRAAVMSRIESEETESKNSHHGVHLSSSITSSSKHAFRHLAAHEEPKSDSQDVAWLVLNSSCIVDDTIASAEHPGYFAIHYSRKHVQVLNAGSSAKRLVWIDALRRILAAVNPWLTSTAVVRKPQTKHGLSFRKFKTPTRLVLDQDEEEEEATRIGSDSKPRLSSSNLLFSSKSTRYTASFLSGSGSRRSTTNLSSGTEVEKYSQHHGLVAHPPPLSTPSTVHSSVGSQKSGFNQRIFRSKSSGTSSRKSPSSMLSGKSSSGNFFPSSRSFSTLSRSDSAGTDASSAIQSPRSEDGTRSLSKFGARNSAYDDDFLTLSGQQPRRRMRSFSRRFKASLQKAQPNMHRRSSLESRTQDGTNPSQQDNSFHWKVKHSYLRRSLSQAEYEQDNMNKHGKPTLPTQTESTRLQAQDSDPLRFRRYLTSSDASDSRTSWFGSFLTRSESSQPSKGPLDETFEPLILRTASLGHKRSHEHEGTSMQRSASAVDLSETDPDNLPVGDHASEHYQSSRSSASLEMSSHGSSGHQRMDFPHGEKSSLLSFAVDRPSVSSTRDVLILRQKTGLGLSIRQDVAAGTVVLNKLEAFTKVSESSALPCVGDRILSINDQSVFTAQDVVNAVQQIEEGTWVHVRLQGPIACRSLSEEEKTLEIFELFAIAIDELFSSLSDAENSGKDLGSPLALSYVDLQAFLCNVLGVPSTMASTAVWRRWFRDKLDRFFMDNQDLYIITGVDPDTLSAVVQRR